MVEALGESIDWEIFTDAIPSELGLWRRLLSICHNTIHLFHYLPMPRARYAMTICEMI